MNLWKKIYGIINGALRFGAQGPTVANQGNNTIAIRDNVGTGPANLDADKTIQRQSDVVATDGKKTNITMQTGAAVDIPVNLPNSKGNNGDVLKTDGNGGWYWDTENQEGVYDYDFNFASANTINLVNMPNGFQINQIVIEVKTPFTGGTGATIAAGIAGDTAKFVAPADSALGLQASFDIDVNEQQALAAQMIATFAANGATAGEGRIIVYGTVPK